MTQILIKFNQNDATEIEGLSNHFKKQKRQLVKLTQPVPMGSNESTDPSVMLKAIQVLQKMLEIMPNENTLDPECFKKITNLIHFPDRKI